MKSNLQHTVKIAAPKDEKLKKRMKLMDPEKPFIITLHLAKLARLKLKCLVTLVSLVECCDPGDNLILRIIRGIPLKVMTNNLQRVFVLFQQFNKDDFRIEAFGKAEEQIDMKKDDEEYYECIIEIGFQIYILMQTFIASKKGKDILQEDIDMREVLNEFEVDNEKKKDSGLFGGFMNLGGQLLSAGLGGLGKITQGVQDAMKTEDQKRKEKEQQEQEEKMRQKEQLKEAIRFFKSHSCSVEIVRDDEVYQVFFPKLPFCDQLPKDLKIDFHDNVNRSSAKTKLNFLMQQSENIIKTMKHEEYLRILFNINPIFGAIASQGKLYELCLFITTIAINLIICFSYSQQFLPDSELSDPDKLQQARLYDPRLFFIEELTMTKQIILIFGILDLVFSSLIVFFFLLKRAPLKVYYIWAGFFSLSGFFKIILTFIKKAFQSAFVLLQDFEILYYSAYILAGIVGLVVHPFLFCVHLMDFLKLDQLKTVVQAMWQPKVELGLALMLLIILEYYFSILAWIVFYDQYPDSGTGVQFCTKFWMCFFTTVDWTFKFTGSIGANLQDPRTIEETKINAQQWGEEADEYNNVSQNETAVYYGRFFFDNIFNIMLVFILLNMIQGIIIDTFGSLREALAEKLKDQQYTCFVCGFDMEKLDKSSDSDKGFDFHIKYEHHMWNYVFYLAYLEFKDPTEYDGYESYVKKKLEALDLNWLPIKKAKCIMDEDQEDKQKLEQMDILINKTSYIENELLVYVEKLEKMYKKIAAE